MVNTDLDTKHAVLKLLKQSPSWISGEEISQNTAVTRVAVWKHIKSLQNQGYPIESSTRGYRMSSEGDILTNLEFSGEKDILFFQELNSTMDEAVRQITLQPEKNRSFTILADHQNTGVNRDEGLWDSPSGGIYMTFVLREKLSLESVQYMKSKGILTALESLASLDDIPNDALSYSQKGELFLNGLKTGGLLEEYQVRGDRLLWYALGLGIHLNGTPPEPLSSVQAFCGRELNRVLMIKKLKELWDLYRSADYNKIILKLEKNYAQR